jgi:hypothetical protein
MRNRQRRKHQIKQGRIGRIHLLRRKRESFRRRGRFVSLNPYLLSINCRILSTHILVIHADTVTIEPDLVWLRRSGFTRYDLQIALNNMLIHLTIRLDLFRALRTALV